jgi:hypothetical protein
MTSNTDLINAEDVQSSVTHGLSRSDTLCSTQVERIVESMVSSGVFECVFLFLLLSELRLSRTRLICSMNGISS